jgi:hypothetical protein
VTVVSNADVTLDGFTIRDGNASTGSPDNSGAGIWTKSASKLQLRNARLLENAASGSGGDGGGLFSEGTVTVGETNISNNSATDRGAACTLRVAATHLQT